MTILMCILCTEHLSDVSGFQVFIYLNKGSTIERVWQMDVRIPKKLCSASPFISVYVETETKLLIGASLLLLNTCVPYMHYST